jgi:hypothetical protein
MTGTESFQSPDGMPVLDVDTGDDGDIIIGFKGFDWHAHRDMWMRRYCVAAPAVAAACLVKDLLNDRLIIEIWRGEGKIETFSLLKDGDEISEGGDGIMIERRYWSGGRIA